MKTRILAVLLLVGAAVSPTHAFAQVQAEAQAQTPARTQTPRVPPAGRGPAGRDALEAQVLTRFVNRASIEMSLDATQRTRLVQVVRSSAQRRKALNHRSLELHRRFTQAVRDPATPNDAFTRLLSDQQGLRREEQQIADTEQTELQRFLAPRQQAQFLMLWLRLQDNARQIQTRVPNGRIGGLPQ